MKEFRMGDLPWNLAEDEIAKLYPELGPDQRAAAAENLSRYFRAIGKIYDGLVKEGKFKDTLLRFEYEKRNRKLLCRRTAKRKRRHSNLHRGLERIHFLNKRAVPKSYF
jgi:hypothetical protein